MFHFRAFKWLFCYDFFVGADESFLGIKLQLKLKAGIFTGRFIIFFFLSENSWAWDSFGPLDRLRSGGWKHRLRGHRRLAGGQQKPPACLQVGLRLIFLWTRGIKHQCQLHNVWKNVENYIHVSLGLGLEGLFSLVLCLMVQTCRHPVNHRSSSHESFLLLRTKEHYIIAL